MKRMKQVGVKLGLAALLLAVLAACGQKDENSDPKKTEATEQAAAEGAATQETAKEEAPAEAAALPAGVDEAKVNELLAQFNNETPAKVVTMSVSITEILSEIGVTPVGVPQTSSELPQGLENVPRVGSSHQPDLEQIAKLQPDVVLGPQSIQDSLDKQFKPASLKAVYLPVDSLDELKTTTAALGRLFKQEEKASAFLEKFAQEEKTAVAAAEGKTAPKVMILFGSAESLMFMNKDTFVGSLVNNLGASNVVADDLKISETYAPLNMENVVAANPDVILLVAHGDPDAAAKQFEADVKKNGAWEKLSAFKNGKLKTLDFSLFGTASLTHAPAAYKELAAILYN